MGLLLFSSVVEFSLFLPFLFSIAAILLILTGRVLVRFFEGLGSVLALLLALVLLQSNRPLLLLLLQTRCAVRRFLVLDFRLIVSDC